MNDIDAVLSNKPISPSREMAAYEALVGASKGDVQDAAAIFRAAIKGDAEITFVPILRRRRRSIRYATTACCN